MKVLFVFFTDPPRPFSSSVAALAAVARRVGCEVRAEEVSIRGSVARAAETIASHGADVVAVSCFTRDWPGASAVLARLPTGPRVVVGGYHATFAPHDVARCARVDAICIGEGELPLEALLRAHADGRAEDIGGLWQRSRGRFEGAAPAPWSEPDITKLPWWDYDVFGDLHTALDGGINTFGPRTDRFLPVRASRGCPFTCTYCSAPAWGRLLGLGAADHVDVRPVSHLVAELVELKRRYAPAGFEFWDEHFPVSIGWLRELAQRFPTEVGLPFKVEMHPSAASRERLELLARAGCVLFHCGVEAGDETLRRQTLGRRTRDRELERVFEDCRALGLPTSASLMTMLPGETRAQTLATSALLRKLQPDSFMWSTYQPLPGTPLGEAAVAEWPGPAAERLDEHPPYATRTPACMSEREREATFRELAAHQHELVAASGPGRPRPVDVPVTGPGSGAAQVPARLRALLEPGPLVLTRATFEGGVLILEYADAEQRSSSVRIHHNEGGRFYRTTRHLGLSYRGSHAHEGLVRTLDRLADSLASFTLAELASLAEGAA